MAKTTNFDTNIKEGRGMENIIGPVSISAALAAMGFVAYKIGRNKGKENEEYLRNEFNRVIKKTNTLAEFIDNHDFYKKREPSEIQKQIAAYRESKGLAPENYKPKVMEQGESYETEEGLKVKEYKDLDSGVVFKRIG